MYELFTSAKSGLFRNMDAVGLDVVLDIESHYAEILPGIPEGPRILLKSYLNHGWASRKTPVAVSTTTTRNESTQTRDVECRKGWLVTPMDIFQMP
jgi:3-hydroxyacyl-CoA dehydrogenase